MVNTKFAIEKNYNDHFKGEKSLILRPENYSFVNSYLSEVQKRSTGSYYGQKCTLRAFFTHLDKKIEEINMIDIKNYFQDFLDKKEVKLKTKETHRSHLTSFFYYVQSLLLSENIELRNPVPNQRIYQFTKKYDDIKKQSEIKKQILTDKQLERILDYCKKNLRKKYFIMFGLLICTGARHSEIRSIRLGNINLEKRFFETGFEKDARKSTLKSDEGLLFFFPEKFGIYLKNYIYSLKKEDAWLFPAIKSDNSYYFLDDGALYYAKKKIENALSFKFKLHKFRNTIINNRLIKMRCPLWLSESLTNHKVSNSTQIKHYASLTIEQKRNLYNEYFPYYDLHYF